MKNLNLLINRTEGSVREAQSFVQVNLREGSTRPRQDLEKTSLKGRALSRMSSFMARSWQVAALIMLLLTLGVGEMWGAWIGNCGVQVNGTWYKSSDGIDGGNWLEDVDCFQDYDLGAITSLVLGGQYDTWDNNQTDACNWNSSNGIHILIKKGDSTIEDFKLTCYHHEKSGNNNVWKTTGGTNGCSDSGSWDTYTVDISGYAAGEYTIKVTWFSPSGQSRNNTANFTIDPVVTFNANGGTGSMSNQTVTYNTATALNSNSFTKAGWSFAGWATASDGAVVYSNGANVTLTANTTLYAKWTQDPAISLAVKRSSTVVSKVFSEETLTLVTSPSNAGSTPTIVYEYSTSSSFPGGSTTTIATTTSTSQSWTVPANTAEATLYVRARVTSSGYECTSSTSTLTAYGKKTIHVRDNNNWGTSNIKIHHWGTKDDNATEWPGTKTGISSMGGQWIDVVVYSCYDGFLLNNGAGTNNQDKTVDLLYTGSGSVTNNSYYSMSTNAADKQTLSSASAPTAPTLVTTTAAPTSSTNAKMTVAGSIGTNGNDNITDYGFYYGTTSTPGTKAQIATSNITGSISKEITGLTAGTTYYFVAYATNGQGTSYGDVESYKLPYKVTVSTNTGCSSITNSGTNYTNSTISVTATKTTGYTFSSWSTTNGTQTSTSSEGNTNTLVFTPSADNATIRPVYTENSYSTNVAVSPASTGSISSPTPAAGKISVSHHTGTAVTASANTNYVFDHWAVSGGGLTVSSTTTNPATFKATAASGTITAHFDHQWCLKGDQWDYWTTSKGLPNTGTNTFGASFTLTKGTKYTFKVHDRKTNTWYGNTKNEGDHAFARGDAAYTTTNESTASDNLTITPDITGDYTFSFNTSDKKLTVTFQPAYTLTYAIGDVNGTDGSISSDPSTTSGSLVLSGSTVTLSAPEAKSGYTWKGWYANSDGSGDQLEDDEDYDITVSATTSVYACYTEDSYTVTVNAGSGGKVSYGSGDAGSSCSASAGVASVSSTIHAIPDAGYAFVGWTGVSVDNNITDYAATWNSTNEGWDLVVNADAATTITANFSPRFALVGSLNADEDPLGGMPGWASEAATTYSAGTYSVSCALTNPNSSYKFQIIDKRAESWAWRGYSDASNNLEVDNSTTYTLSSDKDVYFDSRGVGTYTFTIVEEEVEDVIYPKVKIQDGANSHVVTWGYVTDNGEEGGTITSVVDGEETPNPIASGKYVKDGGSVTVTAKAEDGYRFVDFRTSDTYGEGSQLSTSSPYTVASVTADQNIYAQFAENMCTVTITTENSSRGTITVGGEAFTWGNTTQVGIYTTKGLSVTPAAGYYFSGWTLSATPDFEITGSASDESNTTPTLSGLGGTHGSTGTLTANFVELDKIYFRNINEGTETALWDSVYVGFDPNYWGTGTDCSGGPCGADVQGKTAYKMDKIVGTNIWWAYVPRAFTSAGGTNIVFFNKAELIGHDHFHLGKAAYRGDYRRQLDMFVPDRTKKQTYNETDYYDNGYWGVYHLVAEENVGYYLKDGANTKDLDQFKASSTGGYTYEAVHYINSLDDQYFRIASAGGVFYDANEVTITSSNASTGVMLRSNDDTFTLTPTSEGNYIFRLSQESDSLKLTVIYPVGLGDYRLKHTYTGRNKANSADSTFITYSDVIKANVAGTSATYSMYLNEGGTETLVLQECTGIDGETKLPIWSAGDATNLSGILTKVGEDGNGVYQFDITINTSINKVSEVANIKLYDGPYYIKTDCAPGGWLVYTANPMNKNTANPTAFDYYFVSWIDLDTEHNETKNIKCVIANDYCNAVSDTLRGDGIASIANYGINEPILDNDGSVRFSYNSKTNKLERAYLSGASSLTLETYESGKIYWHETETDQYDRHPGFGDNVLWTYDLTVDAKLGAKAGIRAAWTNKAGTVKEKMLIPTSNMIIDGTGSGTYTMRLVFDFKTNSLMSTWSPNGAAISDQLEDVDVMLVREQQESSDVLSFSGDGSLTPRKMVGCLKFDKADYFGNVSSWTSSTRPLLMFFLSFPFDVKVNDIFGLNSSYGNAFIIRKYDGAERAKKGFFRGDGTTTFWKDLTIADTLHAYEGYLLLLDNEYFNSNSYNIWGEQSTVYLYFPSSQGGTIAEDDITIIVPSHECKLQHYWTEGGKKLYHKYTDSHWNMMGVPVFSNYVGTSTEGTPGAVFADAIDADHPEKCNYFYEWSSDDNNFSIHTAKSYTFKAGHAYLVQYTGEVTFSGAIFTPAAAPARVMDENKDYNIELQVLDEDEEMINRTYVQLRDGASDDFVLNEDVYMASNNRNVEIFTYAGDYDVAANVLSEANHTVEVGVNVHQAGTYTISMPNVFSGTVTLVDTYNQTSTDLSLGDYEVDLDEGTITDRFYLNININKVTTSLENEAGINVLKDGGYHKFIRDDKMFILKNGAVYDAQGRMVE